MKVKIDSFVIGLFVAIILAYIYPNLALIEGKFSLDSITTIGISLIFFFYGLKLSLTDLKAGLSNWKLHVLVHFSTFILFPLLVLLFLPFVKTEIQHQFWLSFFFLAALPSTVSSSVVMVSIAKGNMPAAIFNASISGIIGVIVTPLWMGLFLTVNSDFDFGHIYLGLFLEIILPVILGIALQPYLGKWARRFSKPLSTFDKTIILLIVYKSFADSFIEKIFDAVDVWYFISVFAGVILLFCLVYLLIWYIAKLLKFPIEDQITAIFCGSKKSLTHGSVFAKIIFSHVGLGFGLVFFPIMIYHAFQIFVASIIAQRYAKRLSVKN
ncbi:bile acid:sodium symporter family protein [Sphingobacterium sp. SG20118]|uniref:bile acid:sodium symporter family protein n=1 Tax=Sphingobacterium TaxID=28453 RepID=UPI0004F6AB4D|nr:MULTISPECIES: bile acid:sodium symporter family protein [Sphingobacterium]AIM36478.1 membrane protein [Sphingobacterium sp. ML3W]MDH5827381.1 bile acid:sodium symporter [Sphingobacterium faecium]